MQRDIRKTISRELIAKALYERYCDGISLVKPCFQRFTWEEFTPQPDSMMLRKEDFREHADFILRALPAEVPVD